MLRFMYSTLKISNLIIKVVCKMYYSHPTVSFPPEPRLQKNLCTKYSSYTTVYKRCMLTDGPGGGNDALADVLSPRAAAHGANW